MVRIYALVFALSGISGLIYESVWSHYVKLILGHAAFAQTLVLAIFMGGMAVGSWLASRVSQRLRSLLLAYAAVELAIGMIAIVFQPLFEASTRLLFDAVLPAMGARCGKHGDEVDSRHSADSAGVAAALRHLPTDQRWGSAASIQKARCGTVSLLYFGNRLRGNLWACLWTGFLGSIFSGLAGRDTLLPDRLRTKVGPQVFPGLGFGPISDEE